MYEFKDLVLCKHVGCEKEYLFAAPCCSLLECGDVVMVETWRGEQLAVVCGIVTVCNESLEKFIMQACGAKKLKKVLSKIEYKEFHYAEDEK